MYSFIQKNTQKNLAKIFLITIIFLLFIFSPFKVDAAALSVSPSTGSFEVGNRITIKIIATSNVPFNAVSGLLTLPSSIFSIESVSKAGSILNFWVTEPVKIGNTIKFEGVALGGFAGSSGSVITINLRAIEAGTGNFSFQSGQILANDGEGTDITGNLIGATFSVKEATGETTPTSKLKPKQPTPLPEPEPEPSLPKEVPQPAPTLSAPEIVLGAKYGEPAILGTSLYPKAQTLITFIAEGGEKIFILGLADNDGSFNVLIPKSLKRGTYNIGAVMIKEDKTNSEMSNLIVVKVGNILSDIDWEIQLLIVCLIIAIIYLILRIHFHFKNGKNINKSTKNEVEEAENILHKSFDILREDVIDYDNQKLPEREHKRMSSIKKDIIDAEKIIDKKIKDIE